MASTAGMEGKALTKHLLLRSPEEAVATFSGLETSWVREIKGRNTLTSPPALLQELQNIS